MADRPAPGHTAWSVRRGRPEPPIGPPPKKGNAGVVVALFGIRRHGCWRLRLLVASAVTGAADDMSNVLVRAALLLNDEAANGGGLQRHSFRVILD
jgi:hypothetical protein